MNLYEQELRKIFGESKVLQNPQFCGKTCLAKLDEELRVKIQFESVKVSAIYSERIQTMPVISSQRISIYGNAMEKRNGMPFSLYRKIMKQ